MGMFDSLYDAKGDEWQTKAFYRNLERFDLGDEMPCTGTLNYQVEVLGGYEHPFIESYATVRDGYLASIHDKRDEALPLLNYGGDWTSK